MGTVLGIIGLVAAIWVIIEVVRSSASTLVKVVWVVCAVLFSIITAVVWALWGRKEFGGQKAVI
jgi:phospholipase D-like protein